MSVYAAESQWLPRRHGGWVAENNGIGSLSRWLFLCLQLEYLFNGRVKDAGQF
jgi:hypothetical protein